MKNEKCGTVKPSKIIEKDSGALQDFDNMINNPEEREAVISLWIEKLAALLGYQLEEKNQD